MTLKTRINMTMLAIGIALGFAWQRGTLTVSGVLAFTFGVIVGHGIIYGIERLIHYAFNRRSKDRSPTSGKGSV